VLESTNIAVQGSRRAELLAYDGSRRESTEMKFESHIVGRTVHPFVLKLLNAQRFMESIQ
jgi:hypothetical protein